MGQISTRIDPREMLLQEQPEQLQPWQVMAAQAIDRAIELIQAQPGFTTMTIGRTKGETTMWYECSECGEPVDQKDNFCRNCGRRFKKDG